MIINGFYQLSWISSYINRFFFFTEIIGEKLGKAFVIFGFISLTVLGERKEGIFNTVLNVVYAHGGEAVVFENFF